MYNVLRYQLWVFSNLLKWELYEFSTVENCNNKMKELKSNKELDYNDNDFLITEEFREE